VIHPLFEYHDLEQYPLIAPQLWELAKTYSISANRKSTTRFPTSHRWTVYVTHKSTKGWHKTRFCCFCQQTLTFVEKKSATKFLFVRTFSGRVVATSFHYLTVHRWIAGDVPIYLKFALKVTHPFRKRRFRQILFNSAAAMRASKKVQLSLIGSRHCTFHWAIYEPCALLLSPLKVAQSEYFYICRCLLLLRCM